MLENSSGVFRALLQVSLRLMKEVDERNVKVIFFFFFFFFVFNWCFEEGKERERCVGMDDRRWVWCLFIKEKLWFEFLKETTLVGSSINSAKECKISNESAHFFKAIFSVRVYTFSFLSIWKKIEGIALKFRVRLCHFYTQHLKIESSYNYDEL